MLNLLYEILNQVMCCVFIRSKYKKIPTIYNIAKNDSDTNLILSDSIFHDYSDFNLIECNQSRIDDDFPLYNLVD